MTQRVLPETLRILRNNLAMDFVIHALEIPWKMDDTKLRFVCPRCRGLDTSIHNKVNLARCFSCEQNFNAIDMVMVSRGYPFRKAVEWLLAMKKVLDMEDGQVLIIRQAQRSRLK